MLRQLRVLHVASSQKHDSGDGVTGYHNKLLVKAAAAACLLHQQSPNGPSPNQQQLAAPVLLNMCASVVQILLRRGMRGDGMRAQRHVLSVSMRGPEHV